MVQARKNEGGLDSLNRRIEDQVRRVLDVYDSARENISSDVLRQVLIPTIVVIGDQSHGKSSLLENIAHISLPKGDGCCTKTPLELKLRKRDESKDHDYATIRHKNMPEGEFKVINDLGQIEHEIKRVSDEITGGEALKIVDVPIYLTIYRLNQIDLTMIDLPGMTYQNAVTGTGVQKINKVIKDMWRQYISNKNAVILLTIQATSDYATSQAIQVASDDKIDKQGQRTLTVITKIDLRQSSEPIQSFAGGLGFVCVKNRTNKEAQEGVSFEQARELERTFFESRPDMLSLPAEHKGIDALVDKLVKTQLKMILDYRYEFKEQLQLQLKELEQSLIKMDKPCVSDQERQSIFKESLAGMQRDLDELSTGIYHRAGKDPEMRLRARLDEILKKNHQILTERFQSYQGKEFYERLEKLLQPYTTVHLPNVIDFNLVYDLIEDEWKEIRNSVRVLLIEVTELCTKTSMVILKNHFSRFAGLFDLLAAKVKDEIRGIEKSTKRELDEMIDTEQCSLYLSQQTEPEFCRFLEILRNETQNAYDLSDTQTVNAKSDTQTVFDLSELYIQAKKCYFKPEWDSNSYKVYEMRSSIHSYMLVALSRFLDQCHMWIMQNYIIDYRQVFFKKLDQEYAPNSGTHQSDDVKQRMEEKPSDIKKRIDCQVAIRKLKKSLAEIDQVNRS